MIGLDVVMQELSAGQTFYVSRPLFSVFNRFLNQHGRKASILAVETHVMNGINHVMVRFRVEKLEQPVNS